MLGPVISRLGSTVVCIPATGLDELAAKVDDATASIGHPPERRPFVGHLTLARLQDRAAWCMAGDPFSARFVIDEIAVVASQLDADGPRYTVIHRVPL